ncbi:DUF4291 domain-containing protein [Duganella sp. HH105]|uniref:DUF4291 domain-containing protein n=1 Tax=Duganella sp. HH105 TaxID=1781067 RepID=UPI000877D3AB|nr:DUF4291 domain-containing protein [Duganella sp. HH105]OEZ58191.1 hypothetical protein DUGA6_41550 [Duganella sp. HH105]
MQNQPPAGSVNEIRAHYDEHTIRVYQAYSDTIADAALAHGTFVSPPFKMERMTWIKPSFLWMMYRSGWAKKDADQSRILAVDISHDGFQWALDHSCLSHPGTGQDKDEWLAKKEESPVRVQWDPERDIYLQPLQIRAIQIGLSKLAVELYVNEWIKQITDVTFLAHEIHGLIAAGRIEDANNLLPQEIPYLRNTG